MDDAAVVGKLAERLDFETAVDVTLGMIKRLHAFHSDDLSRLHTLRFKHLTESPFPPLRQKSIFCLPRTLHVTNKYLSIPG